MSRIMMDRFEHHEQDTNQLFSSESNFINIVSVPVDSVRFQDNLPTLPSYLHFDLVSLLWNDQTLPFPWRLSLDRVSKQWLHHVRRMFGTLDLSATIPYGSQPVTPLRTVFEHLVDNPLCPLSLRSLRIRLGMLQDYKGDLQPILESLESIHLVLPVIVDTSILHSLLSQCSSSLSRISMAKDHLSTAISIDIPSTSTTSSQVDQVIDHLKSADGVNNKDSDSWLRSLPGNINLAQYISEMHIDNSAFKLPSHSFPRLQALTLKITDNGADNVFGPGRLGTRLSSLIIHTNRSKPVYDQFLQFLVENNSLTRVHCLGVASILPFLRIVASKPRIFEIGVDDLASDVTAAVALPHVTSLVIPKNHTIAAARLDELFNSNLDTLKSVSLPSLSLDTAVSSFLLNTKCLQRLYVDRVTLLHPTVLGSTVISNPTVRDAISANTTLRQVDFGVVSDLKIVKDLLRGVSLNTTIRHLKIVSPSLSLLDFNMLTNIRYNHISSITSSRLQTHYLYRYLPEDYSNGSSSCSSSSNDIV
ncbi:hypothetical protein SAMD00019534_028320, partial [Acytostelium subglobosum LB1]|uniref:hypothetical protein n=1 Tax=Acytostelium subglobosum LB1 TaxID=1410327 RepID=UPI00064519A0